ncbi:MAG: ABC-2 family transporter protein [Anaerolineales bacterium]|nr:ABC-2 family transporter protein [Anaerolineales bacterium]
MHPLKLAWQFFRVGALNELQYRVNFFVQLLQSLIAVAVGLIGLALVFSHTPNLAGWTRPELLAVMGVYILMGGLIRMTVQPNMQRLMGEVRDGALDFALTKPADSQTLVSVRELRIWQAVDVITGGIVLAVACVQLQEQITLGQALAFAAALLCGGLLLYSFWLILTTGAFWVVRMENIVELFDGIYRAGQYPVGIYPDWLRTGLTFMVPVAFAVTVPAEALTGRLDAPTLAGAAALAAGLLVVARWFWFFGLRRYSGASA